jgi:hypothetical protein
LYFREKPSFDEQNSFVCAAAVSFQLIFSVTPLPALLPHRDLGRDSSALLSSQVESCRGPYFSKVFQIFLFSPICCFIMLSQFLHDFSWACGHGVS